MTEDIESLLQQQAQSAIQTSKVLAIRGGNSKEFYGREIAGEAIDVSSHSGVIDYHPTELVITARAGTPLTEIIDLLGQNNQMLGFEPPLFSDRATLGGAIAAGLSGPARPYRGSVGHFVLGIKLLSGHGEVLRFGGQVIKNVAGFDASRLMAGAMGCLGILLEASLKVVPVSATELTVMLNHADADQSIALMNDLAAKPLPISAAAWVAGVTRIRLSGSEAGVEHARQIIGADVDVDVDVDGNGEKFWSGIRNHSHGYFDSDRLLLRASVAPATKIFCADKPQLIDWGGGLRWYCPENGDQQKRESGADQEFIRAVSQAGGHLTHFRNGNRKGEVFAPLSSGVQELNRRLKKEFDPAAVFNRGRMYADY